MLVAAACASAYADDSGNLLHHTATLDKHLAEIQVRINELQHQLAGEAKRRRTWRALSKKINGLHRKAANITDNWARHCAKDLVAQHAVLVLEDLHLKNMKKSAKGTVAKPGTNVAAKSGLNRSLARAAPGKLAMWAHVKAESAGRRTWAVPLCSPRNNAQPARSSMLPHG